MFSINIVFVPYRFPPVSLSKRHKANYLAQPRGLLSMSLHPPTPSPSFFVVSLILLASIWGRANKDTALGPHPSGPTFPLSTSDGGFHKTTGGDESGPRSPPLRTSFPSFGTLKSGAAALASSVVSPPDFPILLAAASTPLWSAVL